MFNNEGSIASQLLCQQNGRKRCVDSRQPTLGLAPTHSLRNNMIVSCLDLHAGSSVLFSLGVSATKAPFLQPIVKQPHWGVQLPQAEKPAFLSELADLLLNLSTLLTHKRFETTQDLLSIPQAVCSSALKS